MNSVPFILFSHTICDYTMIAKCHFIFIIVMAYHKKILELNEPCASMYTHQLKLMQSFRFPVTIFMKKALHIK